MGSIKAILGRLKGISDDLAAWAAEREGGLSVGALNTVASAESMIEKTRFAVSYLEAISERKETPRRKHATEPPVGRRAPFAYCTFGAIRASEFREWLDSVKDPIRVGVIWAGRLWVVQGFTYRYREEYKAVVSFHCADGNFEMEGTSPIVPALVSM